MISIKNEYKSFLDDIEKNIKNQEDLAYIKKRFMEFTEVVLQQMDNIATFREEDFKKLEEAQKQIENKMEKMQKIIDNIEKDIYQEDGFDFEIVCPYCESEFIIDIDESKNEVKCPDCNKTIELDWSGDVEEEPGSCSGNCSGCSGCDDEDDM